MLPFVGPPDPGQHADLALAAHLERQAAQEESPDIGWGWKVAPTAASLFDAWATRDAMNRGGVEANPFMKGLAGNDALLFGTKAASGALIGYLAHKLARGGHENAAKVVSGIGVAVPTAAGISNLAGGR